MKPQIDVERARFNMVEQQIRPWEVLDQEVLDLLFAVRREEFVPAQYRSLAFVDTEIPLGHGEKMLAPKIEARMVQALAVKPGDRVLEVGTGSGYVTALLSLLSAEVYSVERHAELAASAESTLHRLKYRNVKIRVGDGSQGWPEYAPFDAILVSAATREMPPALFAQLREGGRLVAPVGPPFSQELQLIRKVEGRPEVNILEGCRFVPLVEGSVDGE